MARTYDTSCKELITQQFATLLPWLLPDVRSHEVVKLSEELPSTLRRADLAVRVLRSPRSSGCHVCHAPLVGGRRKRHSGRCLHKEALHA